MNLKELIRTLSTNKSNWNRLNDEDCIHSFVDTYYVNLCFKKGSKGKGSLFIEVDDLKRGINDLINQPVIEGDEYFEDFVRVYKKAKDHCVKISINQ